MKYCKHCNRKNKNSAEECVSCGSVDFKFICENCGTVFEAGTHCPGCGVRAGRSARTCPRCGEIYFTRACPACGYTSAPRTTPRKKKKRVNAGIVLLWIFFLPVMAIIALWKSRMGTKAKIGITAAIAVLTLILGVSGGTQDEPQEEPTRKTYSAAVATPEATEEPTPEPTPMATPEPTPELTPEPTPEPTPQDTPEPTPEPTPYQPAEIPYEHNYHGHVYTGGESSTHYHYEAECAGSRSHEISWKEAERLNPCSKCVTN